ncbi:hypothetical protein ISN45_Aa07g008350 [Arabidopsis thaliana x Arabidopsis arenosa]|uniref:Uncharacterized protein n=2 Tax=Arabidopsis TaxID=3701 RepID=A0A8T1YH16_ARASU|nr:hypothetical protein ISN45_Aa07g008350 [Arabidopsis thaliana x Arabidopsis arenosa]KAG7545364.1 hypothetical protein ISN44_As12g008370 [Arabidopsis suecica]
MLQCYLCGVVSALVALLEVHDVDATIFLLLLA